MQLSTLRMKCYRKHLLKNKQYYLGVNDQGISISEVMWDITIFHQYENLKNPKYTIPFNLKEKLLWKMNEFAPTQLSGFGIVYQDKVKWFESTHNQLCDLKQAICCKIFFGNIQLFNDTHHFLGQGASCKVFYGQHDIKQVYQVKNKEDQKCYAAKCIRKDYIFKRKDEERYVCQFDQQIIFSQRRLLNEIAIMNTLNHENIVKLYDIFEGEKSYYLILEYLEGETLHQVSKKQYLLDSTIKHIMKQLLSGLAYLSHKKILHRDIKLENIVFKNKNDCNSLKIIDFGLAANSTQQLSLCGTPGYIAPEVFRSENDNHKPYDCRCDIYSAGVILHKLLFKRHLYDGKNSDEVLENNKKGKFDQSYIKQSKLPNQTIDLLFKMLEADKDKRITADEALKHPFFTMNITQEVSFVNLKLVSKIKNQIEEQKKNDQNESSNCFAYAVADEEPNVIIPKIPQFKSFFMNNRKEKFQTDPSMRHIKLFNGRRTSSQEHIQINMQYQPSFCQGPSLESLHSQDPDKILSCQKSDHIIEAYEGKEDNVLQ